MSAQNNKIFTHELGSEEVLTIADGDSVTKVSIFNNSAVNGTVQGGSDVVVNGKGSEALTIVQNQTITIEALNGYTLGTITITAGSAGSLQVLILK